MNFKVVTPEPMVPARDSKPGDIIDVPEFGRTYLRIRNNMEMSSSVDGVVYVIRFDENNPILSSIPKNSKVRIVGKLQVTGD